MTQRIHTGTREQLARLVEKLPEEYSIGLVILPATAADPTQVEEIIAAKLRLWQEQDGTILMPEFSAHELFAKWAEEDELMTNEEREAEDRLWDDFQKGINENRAALGMRTL